jgi:tape measure domain-containing protein
MASKVEWALSLLDKTSAPASKVEKSLSLLEKRLLAIDKAAKEVTDPKIKDRLAFQRIGLETQRAQMQMRLAGENTGHWVVKLHSALSVVGMLGRTVGGIARGIASAAIGMGKFAIDAAAGDEARLPALKRLFGGSDASARAFADQMERLADNGPFGDDAMVRWGSSLLSGGFKVDEVSPILKALTDAGGINGFKPEAMEGVIAALRRINAEGALTSKTMRALVEAGVPAAQAYERIGRMFGTTAAGARELVKAGKVSANRGLFAVMDTIRTTRSGGRLGSVGQEYAETTVPGLTKRIQERWGRFFGDLFSGPGFKSYKGFLKTIGDALDSTTATGKKVGAAIDDVFNRIFVAVFGRFAGPDGAVAIDAAITKIIDGVRGLVDGGQKAVAFFEGMGAGLLAGFDPLGTLFGTGALSEDRLTKIADGGREIGVALGKAIDNALALLKAAGLLGRPDFNDDLYGRGAGKAWDIAQNGAWYERAGFNTAGFDVVGGMFNSLFGAEEPSAARSPIAQNWTGAGLPESMRMRPNVSAPVQISIDARGATAEDAQSIADKTKAAVSEGMGAAMMSVAMSTGAQS